MDIDKARELNDDRLLDKLFNGNPVKEFDELFDNVFKDSKPATKGNGEWIGDPNGFQVWREEK
jgi:hypothetical protein